MSKKAIIIGAGPAGLTTAYKLLKETDIIPVIYEKTEFIGGISQTREFNGNRIDLGGHRFFTKNKEVMDLWLSLMPLQGKPSKDDILLNRKRDFEGKIDPETQDEVFLVRNRVSRIYYLNKFFDYPITLKFSTIKNLGFLKTLKAGFGYVYSSIFKRKENNLEDFYINRFGKPLYKMFFEDYTRKVWGRSPSEIAKEWGAQRVKGLSLFKAVFSAVTKPFRKNSTKVEISLIESYYYPKKGPGQMYELMAKEIIRLGGKIVFNAEVKNIEIKNNNINKIFISKEKDQIEDSADYYFSSMAIKDLINGFDNVPKNVKEIAANLPYRDFITVGLLLDKLNLENKTDIKTFNDIVPDCWIYVQDRSVKLGRIQIFNNWSPYMVKDFENKIWIGLEYFANEGDELWSMKESDFIDFAVNELIKIDLITKENVLEAFQIKMPKAYPAYFDSYDNFDKVKDFLNTIDNLYCIGRNGQHRYNNMDHSMLSGIEAVKCIINPKLEKTKIWDVNSEKEYHEIKK